MNKKDNILRTTMELYHAKGETVSLDDISREVGCSKTLIIHYYRNRQGLFSACFSQICHEVRLAFDQVEAPEGVSMESLREYLTELWRAYFEYLKNDPVKARFFIQYSHSHEPLPPRYRTPEATIRKILDERYEKLIEEDEHLFFKIKYMVAIANGMAALAYSEITDVPEDVTERCIGLIMNGVITEPA